MVMWFKTLSLTASCMSLTTTWVRILVMACEKVTSDLGLDSVFLPGTLVPLTTGISYDLVAKWQKERQNRK